MKMDNRLASIEKRIHARIPHSGHIFFATKDRLFEGKLENISRYGLGIKITEPMPLDEIITVAPPFSDGRKSKFKGQVVWTGVGRFGIELFKRRRRPEPRVI